MSFKAGEWIENRNNGERGYVTTPGSFSTDVFVTRNGKQWRCSVQNNELIKLGDKLGSEDLFELINMALCMEDKLWFLSLSSRLKRQAERETAE
jgi:hypothetical protein